MEGVNSSSPQRNSENNYCGNEESAVQERAYRAAFWLLKNHSNCAVRSLHQFAEHTWRSCDAPRFFSAGENNLDRDLIVSRRGYYVLAKEGEDPCGSIARGHFKTRRFASFIDFTSDKVGNVACLIIRDNHATDGRPYSSGYQKAASRALEEEALVKELHDSVEQTGDIRGRYLETPSIESCCWEGEGKELHVALIKKVRVSAMTIVSNGSYSLDDCLVTYRDAAMGLQVLHDRNKVHRDVSEGNMLAKLTKDQVSVKYGQLADFGTLGVDNESYFGFTKNDYYPRSFINSKQGRYQKADDLFALGVCIEHLLNVRSLPPEKRARLDKLRADLTQPDANKRPSAAEAAEILEEIRFMKDEGEAERVSTSQLTTEISMDYTTLLGH